MADNEERMEDLRRILAGREALYSKADARRHGGQDDGAGSGS